MKLTGKCKEDFEKWYESLEDFYHLDIMPNNMVYGVYVDFFDSVGIHISTNAYNSKELGTTYWYDIQPQEFDCIESNIRQEARTQAIKKANEIYNINNGEK